MQILWLDNVTASFRNTNCASWAKDFQHWLPLYSTSVCWKGSQRTFCKWWSFYHDTYHYFRRSAKKNFKKQLREFMFNFKNNEVRKVINHVSTRWLSLGKCLERTLMQWDSLESYFLSNFDLYRWWPYWKQPR